MLELCGILGIAVNELLSGERIVMEDYRKKAEENLIELQSKKGKAQKRGCEIFSVNSELL
jgi:hypothetical protein